VDLQLGMPVAAILKAKGFELMIPNTQRGDIGLAMPPHSSASVGRAVYPEVAASSVVCMETEGVVARDVYDKRDPYVKPC
jgi:hypothetical protein